MSATESIAARIDGDLVAWLKDMAEQKNCTVNDLLKECILLYKQHSEIPENMQFSNLLHVQGAKASIMTYRLLEKFIYKTEKVSKEIIVEAGNQGLKEIDKWKIANNN